MPEREDHLTTSRRDFVRGVATSMAAGVIVTEVTESAAQAEKPVVKALNDPNMTKENITFKSGAAEVKAFLARPRNLTGKAPGVIVIQEIFGLVDHIRDVACRLALQGYVALAPDLYTREGAPTAMDIPTLREFVGKIADSQIVGDLRGAVAYLQSRSDVRGDRIGSVGFCMGGLYSLLLAASEPQLKAAVSFYGRLVVQPKTANKPAGPTDVADRLKCAIQGHYGSADQGIPLETVENFVREVKKHNDRVAFHVYQGAPHAFHNDTRESYRPEAAKLAWSRTLEWFERNLKA